MDFILSHAPEIITSVCVLMIFSFILLEMNRIPRDGGEAFRQGFQITDNPFPMASGRDMDWHLEWIWAEIESRNRGAYLE